MRCRLVFAFLSLLILVSGHALGAEINDLKLLQIVEESLAESDDAMIKQHPQGQRCLLLDFEALVYDIFLNLDNKKFKIIKENFKRIAPKEFKDLREERFDDFNALSRHPIAIIDVESFKSLVFDTLISPQMLSQIGADLENLNEDKVADFAVEIFNTLAHKTTLKKIVELWSSMRGSQRALNLRHQGDCCLF